MSWEPAVDKHDRGTKGEEAVKRLLLDILQQHHPLILFLPHLTIVVVMIVKTKTPVSNHHLVQMEEDNKAVLGVELDEAHLLAEVLDHHPGLPLLRLTRQWVGPELWHPRLEKKVPAQDVQKNFFTGKEEAKDVFL